MSGISVEENIKLRNTWEFIVDKLLEPFNDPNTGYIAKNKGALQYSKDDLNALLKTVAPKKSGLEAALNITDAAAPIEQLDDAQATVAQDMAQDNNAGSQAGWFPYFWSNSETAPTQAEIAEEKPIIPDATLWDTLTWEARYRLGDTVELTAKKVLCVATFVENVLTDMKVPLVIQKPPVQENGDVQKSDSGSEINLQEKANIAKSKDKETRSKELNNLNTRLGLLYNYATSTEEQILASLKKINAERPGKPAKSPATADAYLKIFAAMCLWAKQEVKPLLICLSFEAQSPKNIDGKDIQAELFDKLGSLERKLITYLYRTMFMIELDRKHHEQKEYTGYIREVPDQEATELNKKIVDTIVELNRNFINIPGLRRIKQLSTLIEAVQHTVNISFANTESTRPYSVVSLISTSAGGYFPSNTPSVIANQPNQFLLKMKNDLLEFHTESSTMATNIDNYFVSKQVLQQRNSLIA